MVRALAVRLNGELNPRACLRDARGLRVQQNIDAVLLQNGGDFVGHIRVLAAQ